MTPCRRPARSNASMFRLRALLSCLLLLSAAVQAKPFENSRFETLDGVLVHVRHGPASGAGAGCPVLMVHGLGGSTFSFRELAPALAAAGHPVWAIDLPAYGYSARKPFPGTAGDALGPWLEARQPGAGWCLLGHSMGTRVVGELVRRGDIAVERAVYVAGNPILSARELSSRERYRSPRIRRWLANLAEARYLDEDRFGKLLAKAYGRDPTAAEVDGYLTPLKTPGTALAIMTGYSAEFPENPQGADLDHVPSLILWGEQDAWVKPEVADRLQAALPSARRVTIAGAGHSPMETHPEQTRDAVLALFRGTPAVAAAR